MFKIHYTTLWNAQRNVYTQSNNKIDSEGERDSDRERDYNDKVHKKTTT